MLSKKVCSLGLIFLCAAIVLSSGLKASLAGPDSPPEPVKVSAASEADSHAEALSSSPTSSSAVAGNARLKAGLNWVFGGKVQRGLQLYLPLIFSLIGTDESAG